MTVVDFDNYDAKRTVLTHVGALRGKHRVEIVKFRARRSDRQNSYYWPCIVKPLADWLSEQELAPVSPEDAHEILKRKFLTPEEIIDQRTGEVIGQKRLTTTALDSKQFAEYVDRCAAWLAQFFGIVVPPPRKEDLE